MAPRLAARKIILFEDLETLTNLTPAKSTQSTADHENCSGNSCCVFPVILSFMLGALLRQVFRWIRSHYIPGIPPYTLCIIAIGAGFAEATNKEILEWLEPYKQCLMVQGSAMLHVILPMLAFRPTFNTEAQVFKRSLNQVLLLAVTGYAIVICMTAVVVRLFFYEEWDYNIAIIFGIVVCATDSLAVEATLKVAGVSTNLAALLQGESIIGSVVAMILFKFFTILLVLDKHKRNDLIAEEITIFVVVTMFAPLFGTVVGILTVKWLSRIFNDATLEFTVVLSVVHLCYYASELVSMPGMVTVLFFGLHLSSCRSSISPTVEAIMKKSFRVLADIFNSVVYFYAGVFLVRDRTDTYEFADFMKQVNLWITVNILRAVMVFFLSPVLRNLGLGMSWQHTLVVCISGLNGAFNILVGMMAASDLTLIIGDHASIKKNGAIMVILLNQFINTTAARLLLRTLGLRSMPKFHQMALANAMRLLKLIRAQTINSLKSDRYMADAAFDIVEADTQIDDMVKPSHQRRRHHFSLSNLLKKIKSQSMVKPSVTALSDEDLEESMENRAESILMLIKNQKKTYWRHFERGLMSKEALHQLLEWADAASDHKGKYLDVKMVKEASQVRPILKTLKTIFRGRTITGRCSQFEKRQLKLKLRHLHYQAQQAHGWQYWQQQVLPLMLGYGFHIIDTVAIFLAIYMEFAKFDKEETREKFHKAVYIWNAFVVGIYGVVALGELLVMRLRFFTIVWHDITLLIVVTGIVDLLVMTAVSQMDTQIKSDQYFGRLYVRLSFILSRAVRLLGIVEFVPSILEKMVKLLETRITGELGVGFDVCCAYVTGQVEVARQVQSFVPEPYTVFEIKRHCNRSKLEVIKTIGILALENPTIALSVKTRQAIRIVLNAQQDAVKQLTEEGVLQETDAGLLIKDLEERMKKLLNYPPLVKVDTEYNMIRNVGWIQGDDRLFQFIKDHLEIWTMKPNAVITEKGRHDYNIYIIKSGVARLEGMTTAFNVTVMDYLTAGNVVGEINFLTKAVRLKNMRCETSVSVFVLKEDVMEAALLENWTSALPPLHYRMWLVIAKRVAIKVLMNDPEFQGMSNEHLRMLMFNAYLMDNLNGNDLIIHSDPSDIVILVHGNAKDDFTKQTFKGSCIIPRTCFQLQLLPEEGLYTLLLVIPEEPLEVNEWIIKPTCRTSNIDASILAMSASAEALRLDNILHMVEIKAKAEKQPHPLKEQDSSQSLTMVSHSLSSDDDQTSFQSTEGDQWKDHVEVIVEKPRRHSSVSSLSSSSDEDMPKTSYQTGSHFTPSVITVPSKSQKDTDLEKGEQSTSEEKTNQARPESHVPYGVWEVSGKWEDVQMEVAITTPEGSNLSKEKPPTGSNLSEDSSFQ